MMTIRILSTIPLVVIMIVMVSLLLLLLVVNRQSMPHAQVQPFNFTSNNHVGDDTRVQSHTYDNGQVNKQVVSEQKPASIIVHATTQNYTQIKQGINKQPNSHTTESFTPTDNVTTKIYKQIKSALDMPSNTLTNMGIRLASDREKAYAKLALNNEIKSHMENLIMNDLMVQNTNSVTK